MPAASTGHWAACHSTGMVLWASPGEPNATLLSCSRAVTAINAGGEQDGAAAWPGRGGAHTPEAAGHGEQQLLRAPGVTRASLPAPAPGLTLLRDQRQGRHRRGGRRRCIWLGEEPRLPRDPSPCCRMGPTPLLWPCGEVKGPIGTGLSTGLDPAARRTAPRCCRTGSHSWARPGRAAARLSPGAQARPPSLHRRPPSGPEPRLRPGRSGACQPASLLYAASSPTRPGALGLSPALSPGCCPKDRPDPTPPLFLTVKMPPLDSATAALGPSPRTRLLRRQYPCSPTPRSAHGRADAACRAPQLL